MKYEFKLTLPIARSALSKKKMIPRNEKNIPNPVNPSPISVPDGKYNYETSKKILVDSKMTGVLATA